MNEKNIEWYATKSFVKNGIEIQAVVKDPGSDHLFVMVPVMEAVEQGMVFPKSAGVCVSKESAQRLMDELWAIGLRPTQGPEYAQGQLKATQDHLKDLQALSTRLLEAVLKTPAITSPTPIDKHP